MEISLWNYGRGRVDEQLEVNLGLFGPLPPPEAIFSATEFWLRKRCLENWTWNKEGCELNSYYPSSPLGFIPLGLKTFGPLNLPPAPYFVHHLPLEKNWWLFGLSLTPCIVCPCHKPLHAFTLLLADFARLWACWFMPVANYTHIHPSYTLHP